MCFSAKNKVKPDKSLKIDGKIITEVTSGKTMCLLYAEKLLVA